MIIFKAGRIEAELGHGVNTRGWIGSSISTLDHDRIRSRSKDFT